MASARLALIAVVGATALSHGEPLHVLRISPRQAAEVSEDVTVTFDRPIAAALDSMVDPTAIFRITPPVAGRLEWRDPVTIRFDPAAPLPAGVTFTVRIANTFRAMDGSRLAEPYTFSFRVRGPAVLDAWPMNRWNNPRYLTPDTRFTLLVAAPVDLDLAATLVAVEAGRCVAGGTVASRPVRQRRIGERDVRWKYYGRWTEDTARDLRRIVELVPTRPLPLDCAATLGVPERVDSGSAIRAWSFHTYAPAGVDSVTCGYGAERCPVGPARDVFRTPVRGAEVLLRWTRSRATTRIGADRPRDRSGCFAARGWCSTSRPAPCSPIRL